MKDRIEHVIRNHYGVEPEKVTPLGGGFYGRAFLAELPCEPYKAVAKLYLFPGFAWKEALQLECLSRSCTLKVPAVYGQTTADKTSDSYDVLLMEYLSGVNAGDLDASKLTEDARRTICSEIVDNLIAIHSTVNEQGFGAVDSRKFCGTWQEYYYDIACGIVKKAYTLYGQAQLSESVVKVFDSSIDKFGKIFDLPVSEARLIHGDYNTWNILLTEEKDHAAAVFDPFGCCWGDSEYDLYQLDNANGKVFGLLEEYRRKRPLSHNFDRKRAFYELYSEVSHYHDAKVEVDQKAIGILAEKLEQEIRRL